ncbi:MAG: hypothetical protein ACRD1E_04880 [Terriglobales bacterium]
MAIEGQHLCPSCLDAQLRQGALESLKQRDMLYDSVALWVGWGWILLYFVWPFAVAAVGYLTIAKWKAPRQYLIPRGRWRFALAWVGLLWPLLVFGAIFLIPQRRGVL